MISIDLEDNEAEFFIAMREAKVFELKDMDVIFHFNKHGVLTDISKPEKQKIVMIYTRKRKALDNDI